MSDKTGVEAKELPDVLDIYSINDDGTVAESAGISVDDIDAFIDEEDSGRLFEPQTALYILANFGKIVGVMRSTKASTAPTPYRNRKMILGKVSLP